MTCNTRNFLYIFCDLRITENGCLLTTQADEVEKPICISKQLQLQQQAVDDDDVIILRDRGVQSQVSYSHIT